MQDELNNDFNNNADIKSLEEFFSKEIDSSFTPQELLVMSAILNHVANLLTLYNTYSNIAIFNVEAFKKKHPEYNDIDFNHIDNIDAETLNNIKNQMYNERQEEVGQGSILSENVLKVIINIATKIYDSYMNEYSIRAPKETEPFFAILTSCLESSLDIVKLAIKNKL